MKRPLALVGFSTLLALVAALFVGERYSLLLGSAALILFTVSLLVRPVRKGGVIPVALLSAALAFGSCHAQAEHIFCVNALDGRTAELSGVVADLPYEENYRWRYTVEVRRIDGYAFPEGGKVLLYAKEPIADGPGDVVEGRMYFLLPEGDADGFNYRASLAADSVYLYAFPEDEGAVSTPGQEDSLWTAVLSVKQRLYDAADEIFSRQDAALVKALLFGDKTSLSDQVEEDFRTAGVSHLLAVSGFHMAVMTQLFLLVFRALRLPRGLSSLGVSACILLFMAITGFSPSVSRSGVMCLLMLLGEACSRHADTLNSLGFAALLLCSLNVYAAADVGFLLSVSATAGLAVTEPYFRRLIAEKLQGKGAPARLGRAALTAVAPSVGATLFTIPLLLPVFGMLSPASLPANLLMVYPGSLLLGFGAAAVLLAAVFPPAGAVLAIPASWLCLYLREAAAFLAELPLASFSFSGRTALLFLGCAFLLLGLAVLIGRGRPSFRTAALLCVILFFVSVLSRQLCLRGVTRVSVLSAGDGISVVLVRDGRAAVVGCAGYSETPVVRALQAENIHSLDLLVMAGESFAECSNAGHILEETPAAVLLCRPASLANGTLLAASKLAGETIPTAAPYSVSLWDGEVTVERSGDFLRILCGEESLLLWPDGADAASLPEEWKGCTALLLEEAPDCLAELTADWGVFCMDEDSVSAVWRADYDFLPIATADGTVELRVSDGNETQVRREF